VAPYDATVVIKLKAAGALIAGKTNMDEFAMGSSTETSTFGPTKNPLIPGAIPGGSSGGSCAAVSGGLAYAALGSDTGGSIRQPAACCGVVGLKPSYGRVSRYGLVAFASSLDQIGPITQTVADAALLLKVIAGQDAMDATSAAVPVPDYLKDCERGIAGMKLGKPKEYFSEGLSPNIRKCFDRVFLKLKEAGAEVVDISLPHTDYAVSTYYIICTAEASSNLARYDGVKYGYRKTQQRLSDMYRETRSAFGVEVTRRIMLGTYVLSSGYYDAYYLRAQKVRTLIKKAFTEAFEHCDAIVTPVMPGPPFTLGEKRSDPMAMYLSDIFTIPVNLAGLPAMSLPYGEEHTGIQIIGPAFHESILFSVGKVIEGF